MTWRWVVLCGVLTPRLLTAQHDHMAPDTNKRLTIGAMATGLFTRLSPGPLQTTAQEGYLTQPMVVLAARSANRRWQAFATLNAEGATLQRGELNAGVYGEGYIDRRHPHTYLHEIMFGVRQPVNGGMVAAFAGKGFVPFGSDDPMVRPLVKYPVNHHHAQILERAMIVIAAQWRKGAVEFARFNGDEPEGTTDMPNADRFFDSWATRLSVTPRAGFELSGSLARVKSPEFAQGDGLDQRKRAASVRFAPPHNARWRYAMLEAAATQEYSGTRKAFTFYSVLAEGGLTLAGSRLALRLERTTRPEEERVAPSTYRSIRPLLDFNILGKTKWTNVTVQAGPERSWGWGGLRGRPFVEFARNDPEAVLRPTVFDPREWFGATSVYTYSIGVRFEAGTMRGRFGRYGLQP